MAGIKTKRIMDDIAELIRKIDRDIVHEEEVLRNLHAMRAELADDVDTLVSAGITEATPKSEE